MQDTIRVGDLVTMHLPSITYYLEERDDLELYPEMEKLCDGKTVYRIVSITSSGNLLLEGFPFIMPGCLASKVPFPKKQKMRLIRGR